MTAVAAHRLADDVLPALTPEQEQAEGVRALEALLPTAQERYDAALASAIQALEDHCLAREKLAEAHRKLEALKRKARAAGLSVTPTTTFAVMQAASTDRGWELRRLQARAQSSLRGSW